MAILEVRNIQKVYTTRMSANKVEALKDVTFSVDEGEFVAIMGESGSGKTTLLNLLATLDKQTKGTILLDGIDFSSVKAKEISAFRRDNLGFIFQDFNLLDTFSLKDNILLPLVLQGMDIRVMEEKLMPLSKKLDIEELLEKYPYEVSGGQKQRTAAARALITEPKLVLADEPTGALDSKAAHKLMKLLVQVNESGQTILMVTHSIQAAKKAGRVLFIRDGVIFHQIYRGTSDDEEMYQKISNALTVIQNAGGEADE